MPPVECAGLRLFLWLARILSGSGPWLPLVHAQPQSLLGWHTPLASRGRRTVSTTTHQNLQEACMHYCDGIKFVTRIRTAARARNLVLRVLRFRWSGAQPQYEPRHSGVVLCAHSQKSYAYVAVNCGLNTGRHPAATLEPPLTQHQNQHWHTNRATQQQLPKFGPASKDHHAIDKYEGQFPQYKPLWPPATCQQRGPPRCTSTTTNHHPASTEKVSSHPGAQGDGGPPW